MVCAVLLLSLSLRGEVRADAIDRKALVSRHDVRVSEIDPLSPLSVGNGDFAFTVDATGLQSFADWYLENGIPTETLSTLPWAWHSFSNPENLRREDAMKDYPFHGRMIGYDSLQNSPAGRYFRENPQPLPLGQFGFLYKGAPIERSAITNIAQRLDLWSGVICSAFTLDGQPVAVETVVHPEQCLVAVRIVSPLLKDGSLQVSLRFAYAYDVRGAKNRPRMIWDKPDQHRTLVREAGTRGASLERIVDSSRYAVALSWDGSVQFSSDEGAHECRMRAEGSETMEFTCAFAADVAGVPETSFRAAKEASVDAWAKYWKEGGAVDLAESSDPRAKELERRIVLSRYLMKVNYAGAFPPAESGLTYLTWYGKHNSEMYFWHAAQFYQWGWTDLLEKGLAWYQQVLPLAKEDAAAKGFSGARWPKMAGIDGRPSPGGINPFIIWNFPNPIYLCELVYRARPERATLEKYRDLVFESARFLASYAFYDKETGRYVLGPPLQSVSENSDENKTQNPTFELAYWYYGLKLAQTWRERLGLELDPRWEDILAKLAKLPVADGKYLDVETEPDLFKRDKLPSSMLMALGFLPQTPFVDPEIMRATFYEVCARNGMDQWVSWAMGKGAMTAARLGEPEKAVEILTNEAAPARFLNNGHVRRPKEPETCPAYLPANASLLSAVALMAAGWDGAPKVNAPGFPQDGKWKVKWEGLQPMP